MTLVIITKKSKFRVVKLYKIHSSKPDNLNKNLAEILENVKIG